MSAYRLSILLVALAAAPLHAVPAPRAEEKLASVDGTVTLDGQPLQGARIIFYVGDGQFVGGKTGAGGRYKVRRVPVGTHLVTVELFKEGKSVLPVRYSEEERTPLRVQIREGENRIDLDLQSR